MCKFPAEQRAHSRCEALSPLLHPPSPVPGAPPTVKSTQVKACPVHKVIPRTPLHHLDVCEVCDDFPTIIAKTGDLCFLSFQWSVLLADY